MVLLAKPSASIAGKRLVLTSFLANFSLVASSFSFFSISDNEIDKYISLQDQLLAVKNVQVAKANVQVAQAKAKNAELDKIIGEKKKVLSNLKEIKHKLSTIEGALK